MTKTGTLKYEIDAKCLNCTHMEPADSLEDVSWILCILQDKEMSEDDICEGWKLYSFWDDVCANIKISEVDKEEELDDKKHTCESCDFSRFVKNDSSILMCDHNCLKYVEFSKKFGCNNWVEIKKY